MTMENTPQHSLGKTRLALGRWLGIAFVLYALAAGPDGGDTTRGREVFNKRCTGCHSLDGEKEGPRLRGVYGRKSASVPSFKYSNALQKANIIWDADSLNKWLTDPEKFVPDNDMDFRLVKDDERSDVIAYLRQVSGK